MKTTVSIYDFRREFEQRRPDNFTYEALGLLFEHIEQMESDNGQEIELDVVAICCDYSEDTVEEIARNYSIDLSECGGDYYEISDAVRDYLEENTTLVGETSTGFVYVNF
jgi:hypothetical protein